MRFAVIYYPKNPPPAEAIPELVRTTADWIERHGSRMEALDFFVGGGGYATIDTDDPAQLQRLIAEHPFTPYCEIEVRPLVDPAVALGVLQATYSNR